MKTKVRKGSKPATGIRNIGRTQGTQERERSIANAAQVRTNGTTVKSVFLHSGIAHIEDAVLDSPVTTQIGGGLGG